MESMKRLSQRLLSLLAVLLLLAGMLVPAAPAQAADWPCADGEFWSDGRCVALPHNYPLTTYATKEWQGYVYFAAGTYMFTVRNPGTSGLGFTRLDIDGVTVIPANFDDSFSQDVTLSEGRHLIHFYAASLTSTKASLSWSPINCGTDFRAEYYYKNGELAYGVCTPTLGATWPGGVPTEVNLFDAGEPLEWEVRYSGKLLVDSGVPLYVDRDNVEFELQIGSTVWDETSSFPIRPDVAGQADVTLRLRPAWPGADTSFSLSYCAPGSWKGVYYTNPAGTGNPAFITCEARPDYTWPSGQPGPWAGYGSVPPAFRATWSNDVDLAEGAYRFFVESDQPFTLTVDGTEVLKSDSPDGTESSELVLIDGGTHAISLTYKNTANNGDRKIRLWWQRSDDPGEPPRCPPGTMLAEYTVGSGTKPDFATCEATPAEWGLNVPRHWNSAGTRSAKWAGDVVLLAGNYTFTPKAPSVRLKLNGHQVVSSGASPTYELRHGTYRVEASYSGTTSGGPVFWTRAKLGNGSCSDFTVQYSDGGFSCQPLQLPAQEADAPVLPTDLGSVTWMQWKGAITFAPGRYLFYTPDKGVLLTLQKGTDAPITLDRLSAGASEPAELYLDGTYQITVEYRLNPARPVPRIWWNAKEAPQLVSYRYISQAEQNQYQVELTFDQEVRYPGEAGSAGGSFFLKEIAVDEEGNAVEEDAPITAVSATGNKVTLTATDDDDLDPVSLSYFPSTEVEAIEGTKRPARVELATGKTVTGGGGSIWAPVSGMVGPTANPAPTRDALELSDSNPWWQVDLGEAYWLDEARLAITSNPAAGTLTVKVSVDGEEWTDAATLTLSSGLTSPTLNLGDRRARYVRLVFAPAQSGDKLSINRFEVLGSPGGAIVSFIPSLRLHADGTAPDLAIRPADGRRKIELNVDLIVLTYDDPLDTSSVPELTDYTVTVYSGTQSETWNPISVVVQDNTVTLYLPKAVRFDQDVKLTYVPGTHPVRNRSGYDAGGLTNEPVDPVLTEMINLAQYRGLEGYPKAEQSSNYGQEAGYAASRAIDGSTASVSRTMIEPSPWWQIDMGKVSSLFDLKLIVPAGFRERPPRYQILLSDDGELWTSAYLHDGSGFDADGLLIDLDGQKARYLRITTSETTELIFGEIEIWGYPPRIN